MRAHTNLAPAGLSPGPCHIRALAFSSWRRHPATCSLDLSFAATYAPERWQPPHIVQAGAGPSEPPLKPATSAAGAEKQAAPGKRPAEAVRKVLGLDYGSVWTGLALGEAGSCTPLKVQRNGDNLGLFARKLVELGQSHGVGAIVVGLPVQPGGSLTRPASDSAFGRRCRDFAHTLALLCTKTDMQVLLYDESATSSAALLQTENHGVARLESSRKMSRQAKNAQQIDSWSAAMLLHMYYAAPGRAVRINIRHNGPHS